MRPAVLFWLHRISFGSMVHLLRHLVFQGAKDGIPFAHGCYRFAVIAAERVLLIL